MAANTIEATLRSNYDDQVSKGIEATGQALQSGLSSMKNASDAFSAGTTAAYDAVKGAMADWQQKLKQSGDESDSAFKKISLGAAAMALAAVGAFMELGKAALGWLSEVVKESSKVTELKMAFEGLAGSGADAFLMKLRVSTEGLISTTDLLTNANRVLSAGVDISKDQYTQLAGNVVRLAKAAGLDAAEGMDLLTGALVRGTTRGLERIGIHLDKQILAETAASNADAAATMDAAKSHALINNLLLKTNEAMLALPNGFLTLEDAITITENIWHGYIQTVGEAITRSGVFQELLKRLTEELLGVASTKEQMTALSEKVNQFIIGTLKGIADLLSVLSVFSYVWDTVWGAVKLVVYGAGTVVAGTLLIISFALTKLFQLLEKLPGVAGQAFKQMERDQEALTVQLAQATGLYASKAKEVVTTFGDTGASLGKFSDGARKLASDMEKFKDTVASGTGALQKHGQAAAAAADDQKELNAQLAAYAQLMEAAEKKTASPEKQALMEYEDEVAKANALTLISTEQRNALLLQYQQQYWAKLQDMRAASRAQDTANQETLASNSKTFLANQYQQNVNYIDQLEAKWTSDQRFHDELHQKSMANAASDLDALQKVLQAAENGNLETKQEIEAQKQYADALDRVKQRITELENLKIVTPQQLQELAQLKTNLANLNNINVTPYLSMTQILRNDTLKMCQEVGQAWGQMFSDLVSGQEGAGKKFIAALLNMVSQELMIKAIQKLAEGWGYLPEDPGSAATCFAAGAAIGALAGALSGIGALLTSGSSGSSSSSSASSSSSSSSTDQTQILRAGAPGGAQSLGQAQPPVTNKIELTVTPPQGWVVNQVKKSLQTNSQLRTVIKNV